MDEIHEIPDDDKTQDSILSSIKKNLGIQPEYTQFDPDIIIHINSIFAVLNQLGVGPKEGFQIEDDTKTWVDYMGNHINFNEVKTYIGIRVKLIFDPPLSSAVIEAMKKITEELEWRLSIDADEKRLDEEANKEDE